MTISSSYWITGKVGGCLKACTPFVKVENGHLTVKFDEISMLLFGHNIPGIFIYLFIYLFTKFAINKIRTKLTT